MLAATGGLELAALAGAVLEAWERRLPVILDGYATAVAALAAARISPPPARASSRATCPPSRATQLVLTELGLEPLLDLRMRLGEASGALWRCRSSSAPACCTRGWRRSPRRASTSTA